MDSTINTLDNLDPFNNIRLYDSLLAATQTLLTTQDCPAWLKAKTVSHPLHPVIKAALDDHRFVLQQSKALILEWPTLSIDGIRVAYTRNNDYGDAGRLMVTSVAKYLTRHFPQVADHQIRDLAVLFSQTTGTRCEFAEHSISAYVSSVQNGPHSCMKHKDCAAQSHPYSVYSPDFGWHMALEKQEGAIWGRCLCLNHENRKLFVRSYGGNPSNTFSSNSANSTLLDAWLKDQGYSKVDSWPEGAKLAFIEHGNGCGFNGDRANFIAPYLDGDLKLVTIADDNQCLVIDSEGDYNLRQTNGYATETNRQECDGCGDCYDANDMTYVGYHGNHQVCSSCLEDNYTYVNGMDREDYYICNERSIVTREGDCYDSKYLSHNDIVCVDQGQCEGEYTHQDNTVTDYQGKVWHTYDVDEGELVELTGGKYVGEYCAQANTWTCDISDLIYSDEDDETPGSIAFSTLRFMLSNKRPHNGKGVDKALKYLQELTRQVLWTNKSIAPHFIDDCGNFHIDLRHDNAIDKTLFVAHLDTVHRVDGNNTFTSSNDKLVANAAPLGADDGAGIAILMALLSAKVPAYYIFTQGEEVGGIGAKYLRKYHDDLLAQFDRAIAFDRRSTTSVITHQRYSRTCSDAFAEALSDQLNQRGMMMMPDDTGVYTDTAEWTDIIAECTNISCGYFLEHTDQEWLDLNHFKDLVNAVVKVNWNRLPVARDPKEVDWSLYADSQAYDSEGVIETACLTDEQHTLLMCLEHADSGDDSWLKHLMSKALAVERQGLVFNVLTTLVIPQEAIEYGFEALLYATPQAVLLGILELTDASLL